MKSLCEEYLLAHTIEEAVATLSAAHGSARIISGGSDLLLEIQQGIHAPVGRLVDVTEVEEMCALEIRGGGLFIGASVSLARITHSHLINLHAQALADATVLMANPQVCNVATLGGNVAHALPAADGTIALLALDAEVEVANMAGRRRVPLKVLFKGPGKSTLDPNQDVLVGFYLPMKETGEASAFVRRVNPQGIALAMLNMAIWLQRKEDRIVDARIAVGPSGPIPLRILSAERALIGKVPSPEVLTHALDELLKEAHFRTSPHRATAEYRRQLAGVLLQEALIKAWQRAE
jgi:carbon-monoxide dehydrogenase medium subunit